MFSYSFLGYDGICKLTIYLIFYFYRIPNFMIYILLYKNGVISNPNFDIDYI